MVHREVCDKQKNKTEQNKQKTIFSFISLSILSHSLTAHLSFFSIKQLVLAARKRQQQPYEAIISALKDGDLNIKVGALNVINAFIEHSPDKTTFEEFLVLIEGFGYLGELKVFSFLFFSFLFFSFLFFSFLFFSFLFFSFLFFSL